MSPDHFNCHTGCLVRKVIMFVPILHKELCTVSGVEILASPAIAQKHTIAQIHDTFGLDLIEIVVCMLLTHFTFPFDMQQNGSGNTASPSSIQYC